MPRPDRSISWWPTPTRCAFHRGQLRRENAPPRQDRTWLRIARAIWFYCVLGGLLFSRLAGEAWAIALFPRTGGPPVVGYLVREDDQALVVREEQPDGSTRETRVLKSQIAERIDAFSPERLEALSPDRPRDYLEYAEELAQRRRDPEARDTALRLYLIAIARGDERVRHSAWRGLVELARTPVQRQTFLAAAAWHGVPLEADQTAANATGSRQRAVARAVLLDALVKLRQGKGREARTRLDHPGVRDEAAALAPWLTWEQLIAACSQQELELALLARLLRGELWLRSEAADPSGGTAAPLWSQARGGNGLAPLPSLELDALTPFDPSECLYRAGRWQRP